MNWICRSAFIVHDSSSVQKYSNPVAGVKVFLLAGEASGDRLGAALMKGLKSLLPDVQFRGVSGPDMQAEGLESLFPMSDLSVMGIVEVLPKYPHLKRRLREAARDVLEWQPDVLVTIDSPDFSLRLAKLVKESSDIRTVHYVAPSVWAWRPGRAKKMARHIDQVLALLPFEPPYMEAAGMRCDFVGHPVVADLTANEAEARAFRQDYGVGDAPLLLVLPGSRRSEIDRLLPVFRRVHERLAGSWPDLKVVVPAAAGLHEAVSAATSSWQGNVIVLDSTTSSNAKAAAFKAADVALAASGTVSLELAASETPMVVAYDMSWLSWQIMSRLARIDTVTLVNLVSETRAVPEFLGPDCDPVRIARALETLLSDEATRAAQIKAMKRTMKALGKGKEAPGLRAARAVIDGLNASP